MTNGQLLPEKKVHEKSALYPAVTIAQCLDFIKQIDSLGGKAVSYATILNLLGLTSPTTKSFLSRISASKQYGFITTGGSTAQLTDTAKRILYPTDENEKEKLLCESFYNPPLYTKLIERFKDRAVPPKNQLANILMNEYRIIKQVKDNAAECFIESATYVKLLQNGVLCLNTEKNEDDKTNNNVFAEETDSSKPASVTDSNPKTNISSTSTTLTSEQPNEEAGYNFEIPTLGKKTARFYIPDGVTEKDLDYIKLYIENMLPVFLNNLKSEIKEEN